MKNNIGIVGIGLMGRAFAERFHTCGYQVHAFNRSRDKVADLEKDGISVYDSLDKLIENCSTIIFMVSNAEAINELLSQLGDKGDSSLQCKTILQMATISPAQSKSIAEQVSVQGGNYLEAPVLGSIPEAKSGTLIIMAGGSNTVFQDSLPVLKVLGQAPRHIGPTGSAAALKLAMNQLIATLTAGFSLSLGYAQENDVDPEVFMDTVRASALYAKTYDKKLDKYLQRDFGTANFSTRHLLKDIRLFIEDAQSAGLDTSALQAIEQITRQTVEDGFDAADYSSIFRTICPAPKS